MMKTQVEFTRRHALLAGAALPLAAGGLAMAPPARAAAPMQGAALPPYYRFRLGDFEVTTLLAGMRALEDPQGTFGMNVSPEEFAEVSAAHFIPADQSRNFFIPVLLNTGAELVLFDTGLDPMGITAALAAAGHSPDQVDLVVLTHMHGDHIGGLMENGMPTFINARYATGQIEFDHWAAAGNAGFDANVRPLADMMSFLADGDSPVAGVTALFTPGHTPGHMSFRIDSGGQGLVLGADLANHYVWSLGRPDWEVRFDADKAQAATSRRALLGMLAAEGLPFIGYHMPFPGVGFIEAVGDDFRFVPASYQLMLAE